MVEIIDILGIHIFTLQVDQRLMSLIVFSLFTPGAKNTFSWLTKATSSLTTDE